MVGGSVRLRGALLLAASSPAAPVAHAGAWSVADGEQQWFAAVSRESGDFGQAWRADALTEVGVGDGWQVVAKLESQISTGDTYDDRTGFRLGVQKAFAIDDRTSFSLLASYLGGESLNGVECAGGGYKVCAAVGTSFSLDGRDGFVNVEAGHRAREDCERNVFEVATGLEFASSWNPGRKAWQDGGSDGSTKAELNLGYEFGGMGVGIGGARKSPGISRRKAGLFRPVRASDSIELGDHSGLACAPAFVMIRAAAI